VGRGGGIDVTEKRGTPQKVRPVLNAPTLCFAGDQRNIKESDANARKRTDPRPAYIELGDDTDGASHVYRTTDETIHVVQG
jgi:hypothetical protein